MSLKEFDVVRVVKLLTPNRHIDGSQRVMRQPRVGDIGTIVHVLNDAGLESAYLVEAVNPDGLTLWLADFLHTELALEWQSN
jgi:hypothetical protein